MLITATMAATARAFLSIEKPSIPFVRNLMTRAVRMLIVVLGSVSVAMAVVVPVAALVDDLRGDVDGRQRREDEGLQEAGEDREEEHRGLDRHPAAAEGHQFFRDLVLAEDVAVETQREG